MANAPNIAIRGASLSLYFLLLSTPNIIIITPIKVIRITIKSISLIFYLIIKYDKIIVTKGAQFYAIPI